MFLGKCSSKFLKTKRRFNVCNQYPPILLCSFLSSEFRSENNSLVSISIIFPGKSLCFFLLSVRSTTDALELKSCACLANRFKVGAGLFPSCTNTIISTLNFDKISKEIAAILSHRYPKLIPTVNFFFNPFFRINYFFLSS